MIFILEVKLQIFWNLSFIMVNVIKIIITIIMQIIKKELLLLIYFRTFLFIF